MSRYDQGWRVNIVDDWTAMTCQVFVYRQVGDGAVELMTGERSPDGFPVVSRVDASVTPDGPSLRLPYGCLDALREAIDRTTGRRSDEAVAEQLRDDLAAERARVDLLIDRATRPMVAPAQRPQENP